MDVIVARSVVIPYGAVVRAWYYVRMTSPQPTPARYEVVAPTAAGAYHQRLGWRVVTPTGWTAYSGDKAGANHYAAAMNRRKDLP